MTELNALIVKALIVIIIISFISTTIASIIKGVCEGIRNGIDLFHGISYEEIREKERKKQLEEEQKTLKKMDSKLYRITHPIEYFNIVMFKKLREKIKDYGKRI